MFNILMLVCSTLCNIMPPWFHVTITRMKKEHYLCLTENWLYWYKLYSYLYQVSVFSIPIGLIQILGISINSWVRPIPIPINRYRCGDYPIRYRFLEIDPYRCRFIPIYFIQIPIPGIGWTLINLIWIWDQ